ncbi:hypothetical protein Voc01_049730 [Virgisporangium ochraceum]|uniref:DUF7779 domain-containing protein n=1 Tax=Virgisporangium ochraceum TaxID=65505 RepID=A0A8J3ZZ75_9ACTN|nr:hypothetical protein Voc01_049730 [Virgisporangium ochraceum]
MRNPQGTQIGNSNIQHNYFTAPQPSARPTRASNIPAHGRFFVGRHDQLAHLERLVARGGGRAVLCGTHGVGKTQLAIELLNRCGTTPVRWWIPAAQPETIAAELAALGRAIGLPELPDRNHYLAGVLADLGERDDWLVVFDNATRPASLVPYLPAGGGTVLITSVYPAWGTLAERVPVGVFSDAEAVELLSARTPMGAEQALALAQDLGALPLALDQAVSYLEQTGLTADEYLGLLRRNGELMLNRGAPSLYGATVDATFRVAVEQVEQRSTAALELLEICAVFAPADIPHDLLRVAPEALPPALAAAVGDDLTYADTVGVLTSYSLVRRDVTGLQVHSLVQAVTRRRMDADRRGAQTRAAGRLLIAAFPSDSYFDAAIWPTCERLLAHLLAVVTELLTVLPTAPDSVDDAAELLHRAGVYRWGRQDFDGAREHFARAAALREERHGGSHPDVAVSLNHLGLALRSLGRLDEAATVQRRALAIREEAFGPHHPAVAITLNDLGTVHHERGRYAEALELHRRAIAIRRSVLGSDDPFLATSLANLGATLTAVGRLDDAAAALDEALVIRTSVFGPTHPRVAFSLERIALNEQARGSLAEARAAMERAIEIRTGAYGPDHELVRRNVSQLASMRRAGDAGG